VTDVAGWTYEAAAHRSALALAGSAALGIISGLGPCAVARGAAIAAMTEGAPRRAVVFAILAYAAGTGIGYVAYGTVAGIALRAAAWSSLSYGALAVVLACAGISCLVRPGAHAHRRRITSAGGAALLGLGASLTLSPCCTPFVVGLTASAFGDLRFAVVLLSGFTLGHIAPAAGMAAMACAGRGVAKVRSDLVAFASGTIALAMSAYYGLLA
jgi:hypothetical protein